MAARGVKTALFSLKYDAEQEVVIRHCLLFFFLP